MGGGTGAVILRQDMQVPGFAAGLPGGEGFAAPELLPAVHREGFAPGPDKLLHGGVPHTDSGAGGAPSVTPLFSMEMTGTLVSTEVSMEPPPEEAPGARKHRTYP